MNWFRKNKLTKVDTQPTQVVKIEPNPTKFVEYNELVDSVDKSKSVTINERKKTMTRVKLMKPGQRPDVTGVYEESGAFGQLIKNGVRVKVTKTRTKSFPPTTKPGRKWRFMRRR